MSSNTTPKQTLPPSIVSFLSGGVGGVCSTLVGHPFDLVKVRMQTSATMSPNTTTFSVLKETLAKDGVRKGLYRGVSAPIVAIAPIYATCFWGYDVGCRAIRSFSKMEPTDSFSLLQISLAGGFSAIPTTILMTPSERIKCLLQVQGNEQLKPGAKPKYTGMLDCGTKLVREGGIRNIYKGSAATLIRDVPGSIAWFGAYEIIKSLISEFQGVEKGKLSPLATMFAGGCAGISNWVVALPLDIIKTRLQTSPDAKATWGSIFRGLVKEEGVASFYRGVGPAMIRAFPANASCFLGMEVSRSVLESL